MATIGRGTREIGGNCFAGSDMLADIRVAPDHPWLEVIDGVLFSKDDRRLICFPSGLAVAEYMVPDGTREIGERAFISHPHISRVVIPDSVTKVDRYAFYGCKSLGSVQIAGGVTDIGSNAFQNCTGLTEVLLPEVLLTIGDNAFYGCWVLEQLNLPASVTAIGADAFRTCYELTLTVPRGSFAEGWCEKMKVDYIIPDTLDWLLD